MLKATVVTALVAAAVAKRSALSELDLYGQEVRSLLQVFTFVWTARRLRVF